MQQEKKNVHPFYKVAGYLVLSALLLLSLLWLNHYQNSQVYVVYLDDSELGIVSDHREIENFIADLVLRCSSLYGLDLQLEESIIIDRELRPGSEPDPAKVRNLIRSNINFLTAAYLIKVDGKPLVPVATKNELDEVVNRLVESYSNPDSDEGSGTVIEVAIVEEIKLEQCMVAPENLLSAEEVLALLTDDDHPDDPEYEAILVAALGQRDYLYTNNLDNRITFDAGADSEGFDGEDEGGQAEENKLRINVKTLEEITVIESIPFSVEQVKDYNLFVNQSEIEVPGQDGKKEVVYHIHRENGTEIERITIGEKTLEDPVAQVERVGSKELPSGGGGGGGSGSFIWPVQGEGIVYNGFKPGHLAIDIHIEHGTNILAADSGTVFYTGWGGTQGNYIIIHHGAYWTLYLHNSVNLVQKGDHVSRGQVIGKVGATGRAKGAHLHFEIREDDGSRQWLSYYQHKAVNPMQFFR